MLTPFRPATAAPSAAVLVEELHKLPVHNTTALRILARLEDPEMLVTELSGLIQGDPALALRVLRLANSSFFGLRSEVSDVERAIMAVGFSTVRTFTLAAAFDLFTDRGADLPADFWHHSLAVASASAVLARRLRLAPGDAFSAGLLHDLGEALLHRHAPERYELCRADLPEGPERLERERAEFGTDHAEVAAIALRESRFPRPLVDAIADHHQPPRLRRGGKADITAAVAAGEAFGSCLGPDGTVEPGPHLAATLEAIGVDPSHVDATLRAVAQGYVEASGFITP